MEELGANLKDLEAIVQGKSNNLRVVEDGKSHFKGDRSFLIFICFSFTAKSTQRWHCFSIYILTPAPDSCILLVSGSGGSSERETQKRKCEKLSALNMKYSMSTLDIPSLGL